MPAQLSWEVSAVAMGIGRVLSEWVFSGDKKSNKYCHWLSLCVVF